MQLIELFESLNSAYDYSIKTQGADEFSAKFTTEKNETYSIDILFSDDSWELSFAKYNYGPGKKWSFDRTGSGDQFKVFATIIKFTNEFIKKYNPEKIEFSAKMAEESRSSLYKKLLDRYITPKYTVDTGVKTIFSGDEVIVFTITKKK